MVGKYVGVSNVQDMKYATLDALGHFDLGTVLDGLDVEMRIEPS